MFIYIHGFPYKRHNVYSIMCNIVLMYVQYIRIHITTVEGTSDMKYDGRSFVTPNGQQITVIVREDGGYLCASDITSILPQFNRSFLEKKRGMRYVNANRLEIELLKQRGLVAKKACRAAMYSAKTIVDICYSNSVQPPSFLADFACEKVCKLFNMNITYPLYSILRRR